VVVVEYLKRVRDVEDSVHRLGGGILVKFVCLCVYELSLSVPMTVFCCICSGSRKSDDLLDGHSMLDQLGHSIYVVISLRSRRCRSPPAVHPHQSFQEARRFTCDRHWCGRRQLGWMNIADLDGNCLSLIPLKVETLNLLLGGRLGMSHPSWHLWRSSGCLDDGRGD
jgi:hypothetical protein